jgi:hypothetical protein
MVLIRAVWAVGIVLSFAGLLGAQEAIRAGLSSFPADTQQVAYSNFAQLRSSSDYPQIRQHVLYQQLRGFQEFLRSVGVDPERDINEVMLGWRGESPSGPGSFGVATGTFDPAGTFFTFLDSSLAAFGQLHDLKAILDVREGSAQALDTNQKLRGFEAELEGVSPQWGILTGKAAGNVAAPWLAGGKKNTIDMTAFLQPIQAVLYRVDWDGGFTVHISVACVTPESAAGLFQLLNILKSAPVFSASGGGPGSASLLQNLEAHQNGSRLELDASGPADALDQVLKVGE